MTKSLCSEQTGPGRSERLPLSERQRKGLNKFCVLYMPMLGE